MAAVDWTSAGWLYNQLSLGHAAPQKSRSPRGIPTKRRVPRHVQAPADELAEQLQAAWDCAGAIQAELKCGEPIAAAADPVSAMASGLSEQARLLEQDITSGGAAHRSHRP